MEDALNNNPHGAFLSNIFTLDERSRELYEARVCEISLYAERLAEELLPLIEDGASLREALSTLFIDTKRESKTAPCDSFIDSGLYMKLLSGSDRAELAKQLSYRLSLLGVSFLPDELFSTASEGLSVCYVKNALSDEAYEVFSEERELSVSYVNSFDEACLAVRDGVYGYCILPLEEAGGVRSRRIMSMLRDLSLKIVSITPVFGFDGTAEVKYALVSQGISVPERDEGDEIFIDLLLGFDDTPPVLDLLVGCETLGLLHTRVGQTVSADGRVLLSLVLKDTKDALIPLYIYLTLYYGDFDLLGVYKNLE